MCARAREGIGAFVFYFCQVVTNTFLSSLLSGLRVWCMSVCMVWCGVVWCVVVCVIWWGSMFYCVDEIV